MSLMRKFDACAAGCFRFTVSVVLYGLSAMITTMEGNKYVILFLCGAAEIPSNVISAFIFQRYIPTMTVAWLSFYLRGVGVVSAWLFSDGSAPVERSTGQFAPNILT